MAAFIVCLFVILCAGTLLAQANWADSYHKAQTGGSERYRCQWLSEKQSISVFFSEG